MGNAAVEVLKVALEKFCGVKKAEDPEDPEGAEAPLTGKETGPSPVYDELPDGAEEAKVRNVYDGDTLTLLD